MPDSPGLFTLDVAAVTVAIDTIGTPNSGTTIAESGLPVAITIGAGTNRAVFLAAGAGHAAAPARQVDSVVSNVDGAFTFIDYVDDANWTGAELWYLKNPTLGAHTITVIWSILPGGVDQAWACAISFNGVDQTTSIGTATKSSGTGTTPTSSPVLATGDIGLSVCATDSAGLVDATTGTRRAFTLNVATDTAYAISTITGTGATAMTWSTTSDFYSTVAVPIKHA